MEAQHHVSVIVAFIVQLVFIVQIMCHFSQRKLNLILDPTLHHKLSLKAHFDVYLLLSQRFPLIHQLFPEALLCSDMKGCWRNEARLCHMPSPLAFSPSPAALPRLPASPSSFIAPATAPAGILPLCLFIIPPLHQWLFHRASGVGFDGIRALSEECCRAAFLETSALCHLLFHTSHQ